MSQSKRIHFSLVFAMEPVVLDVAKVYESQKDVLKKEDVMALKEWADSKKFYAAEFDELELIFFLCECEYDVEKAKKRITNATIFQSRSSIFQNMDFRSDELKAAMDTVLVSCLTLKDEIPGQLAIYMRVLCEDAKLVNASNLIKVFISYSYLWFRSEVPPVNHILIVDLDVVTLAHLGTLDLRTLRELSCFYNHFYFGTLMKVHLINVGPWIDRLLGLLKTTMGREFSEKICVHRDASNLHEFMALGHLPKELGGDFLSFNQLHVGMKELLEKHADELMNKYKVHSSGFLQIHSAPHTEPDLFGVDGTFRQLEVD
ncbi:uncharacterized protein LOC129786607 [Lutzomyia longipalpis]|uniref:uncharacterized protein LOC129786607 n=1 Tax=Lutzomyia longipalpis TaxID=7200 RepID=UPI0024839AB3|nr:uncharacterized protein LOC129786607 [Lutzomyia longipalpis]